MSQNGDLMVLKCIKNKQLSAIITVVLIFVSDLAISQQQGNFNSCSRNEIHTLITDQEKAILFINEWLNNYLTQNIIKKLDSKTLGAYGNFSTAIHILRCTKNVIEKGLTYQCNANIEIALARTYPIFGNVIELNSTFFNEEGNHRAGMIIHEATHKCGTTDLGAFYNKSTPPKGNYLVNWPKIADSYEYWAEFGFCYPEIDCEK